MRTNATIWNRCSIINGRHPERILRALEGEHVGTIVYAD